MDSGFRTPATASNVEIHFQQAFCANIAVLASTAAIACCCSQSFHMLNPSGLKQHLLVCDSSD